MGLLALIVRLMIGAMFAIAGIAKLTDLRKTQRTIRDFGVPEWAAKPLGLLLPPAEIGVALLLVAIPTVFWGSVGAIALLSAFIVGIVVNLASGRRPQCNCFGQLHSEPIGWPTLARNCVLMCGATLVLWDSRENGPLSIRGWTRGLSHFETVLVVLAIIGLVAMAAESWLCLHLLRQNGRLLLRMDAIEAQLASSGMLSLPTNSSAPSGLPVGYAAPGFELALLSGGSITLNALRNIRLPIVLIFSDPDCGPCSALLPDVARWEREYSAKLTFALISRGEKESNRTKIGKHQLKYVLLQKDHEVSSAYQVNGTPGGVLIDAGGMIASPVVMGAQSIANLVTTGKGPSPTVLSANGVSKGVSQAVVSGELRIGEVAPPIKLPDLDGKTVDLIDFRSRETLVLFWNPNCGFCSKMLPDLKKWEQQREAEAPQLLLVSSGTASTNRAMGLKSPIVLDQSFALGSAFHVRGTPAAVLIDTKGEIASAVATGADAVLNLANKRISVL